MNVVVYQSNQAAYSIVRAHGLQYVERVSEVPRVPEIILRQSEKFTCGGSR